MSAMNHELDASIVIPSHNRRHALELVLVSLKWQRHPAARYEVILVDDGSTDGTREWLHALELPANVTLVLRPNGGRGPARNTGLARARGRIVIFCDADAIPDPAFVSDHVVAHAGANDRVVCGNMKESVTSWSPDMRSIYLNELECVAGQHADIRRCIEAARRGERVELLSSAEIERDFDAVHRVVLGSSRHSFANIRATYGPTLTSFEVPWTLFITQNVSVSRALLDRVGGFDESFVGWGYEDTELGYRLYQAGAEFRIPDGAWTYHQSHALELGAPGNPVLQNFRDLAANYRRFFEKHPTLEVYLHWRVCMGTLTGDQYSNLVATHRREADGPLKQDYVRMAHAFALEYAGLEDPTPFSVRRTHALSRLPQNAPATLSARTPTAR